MKRKNYSSLLKVIQKPVELSEESIEHNFFIPQTEKIKLRFALKHFLGIWIMLFILIFLCLRLFEAAQIQFIHDQIVKKFFLAAPRGDSYPTLSKDYKLHQSPILLDSHLPPLGYETFFYKKTRYTNSLHTRLEKKLLLKLVETLKSSNASHCYCVAVHFRTNFEEQIEFAIPILISSLQNGDVGTQINSAIMLGCIGPRAKAAIPLLINSLKDPSLCYVSIWALGEIAVKNRKVIVALQQFLEDKNKLIQECAEYALNKIKR